MNNLQPPAITTDQMREVDRLMIDEYGISLDQMMENAGRNLADLALELLTKQDVIKENYKVVVACGTGNNGGGGMVAARFLSNRGVDITVIFAGRETKLKPVPQQRWDTLKYIPITTIVANSCDHLGVFDDADLIIDAIIGYGLTGEPRGIPAYIMREILNSQNPNILSLDVPSGLDATNGNPYETCIKAKATMTLALPKSGLTTVSTKDYVGELFVADIGVPPELYTHIGLSQQNIFGNQSIIKIS